MTHALKAILPKALQSHDLDERLDALQALKNDVVGHVQKKEKWLEAGVLEPIVKSLNTSNRSTTSHRRPSSLSVEEDVRLQALQLLSSFAKGVCSCSYLSRSQNNAIPAMLILSSHRWLCLPSPPPFCWRHRWHTVQYYTTREPPTSHHCRPKSYP